MKLRLGIFGVLTLGALALTGCGGDAPAGTVDAGPQAQDTGVGQDTGGAPSDLTAYQWETLTMSAPAGDSVSWAHTAFSEVIAVPSVRSAAWRCIS